MSNKQELRERLEAKKHEWQAELQRLKNDSSEEASKRQAEVEAKISEAQTYLGEKWDSLTEQLAGKVNNLLSSSENSQNGR